MPQGAGISMGVPCSSKGFSSSSISRSAAVNTLTKAGTSFVKLRAGLWIRLTNCKKAVIPPNVNVCCDILTAAQRKATRYPRANPKLRIRLEKTLNAVRRTTLCRSWLCIFSKRFTITASLSKVLMSIRCWIVSCRILCTRLSESRTCRVSRRICPI